VRDAGGALENGDVRRLDALQLDVRLGGSARMLILLGRGALSAQPRRQAFDFSGGRRIS
jgi:hypothetical protein